MCGSIKGQTANNTSYKHVSPASRFGLPLGSKPRQQTNEQDDEVQLDIIGLAEEQGPNARVVMKVTMERISVS